MSRRHALARRSGLLAAVSIASIAISGLASPAAAQTAASAYTSGFRWDAEHRLVGTISPDPDGSGTLVFAALRYSYDGDGKLIKIEKGTLDTWKSEAVAPSAWSDFTALETTSFAYDAVGNKVEERMTTAAGGTGAQSVTHASYDADDRLRCTAVRMNMAAIPAASDDACVPGAASAAHGADRITMNVYDTADQLVQVRKAVGTPLVQAYVTYGYTGNGKQEYVVDANGNRARFVYDGHDRRAQWRFPSPVRATAFDVSTPASALSTANAVNDADYEAYGYDATDNRTSLRKRSGATIASAYDPLGRVQSKAVPANGGVPGYTVSYVHDLVGRQLEAKFSNGQGVIHAYDNADRLISSTNVTGGTTRALTYLNDKNGNRTRVTHPDGAFFAYGYDGLNRLISIDEGADGPRIASIVYDSLGRRKSATRDSGTITTQSYDAASRLASLKHAKPTASPNDVEYTFVHNPADQMVSRVVSNDAYVFGETKTDDRLYTADGLNRYGRAGQASLVHGANGNVTGNGAGTAFAYDNENRLVAGSGGRSLSLAYDPLGRLARTVGKDTREYLYDGDALVAEYDGAGNLVERYVHGGLVDEPVVWYEGGAVTAAARRHLLADRQGSIVGVTDAGGSSVAINSYDAWGKPNSGAKGRFLYTGQIILPELGLYHYKARTYSAALGRFLQTDPIGYDDQINLYAYVDNDSMNEADPSGLSPRWREVMREQERNGNLPPRSLQKAESTHTTVVRSIITAVTGIPAIARMTADALTGRSAAQDTTKAGTETAERVAAERGLKSQGPSATGGERWGDGKGNAIRIEPGRANAEFPSQRGPYVKETVNGTVRDVNGNVVQPNKEFPKPSDNPAAHIPLSEWAKRNG